MRGPVAFLTSLGVVCGLLSPTVAESPKVTVTRRITTTEEELREQLLLVKEVGYNQASAATLYEQFKAGRANPPVDVGVASFTAANPKTAATLPWQKGPAATRGKQHATTLNELSTAMRTNLRTAAARIGNPPDPATVRRLVMSDKAQGVQRAEWQKVEAIPTLMQMLQVESTPLREMLVDILAGIEGPEATKALAQRALFDLSPKVREQAVQALADRPEADYRQTLLDGLRYPWVPVNDHAAEALVALKRTDYVGRLVNLLKEPDPRRPVTTGKGQLMQELVRVNHMSNCLLCHAMSQSSEDLVRGLIPEPYKPAPPLYYSATRGSFARADITYLRQDFSLVQPVLESGHWPSQQRYDYLLRSREATETELLKEFTPRTDLLPKGPVKESTKGLFSAKYPERGALLFALRQLTKKDLGATFTEWAAFADRADRPTTTTDPHAEGHALSAKYFATATADRPTLLATYQTAKGGEYTVALVAMLQASTASEQDNVQIALVVRLARMNAATLTAYMKDRSPVVRQVATRAVALKDKSQMGNYVPTLLVLLADESREVVQAARSALQAFAGVDHGPEPTAKGPERLQAVTAWHRWWTEQKR